MDPSLVHEARSLIASARALLGEFVEEGVEAFSPAAESAAAGPPADREPRVAGDAATSGLSSAQPALLDAHPWGSSPTLEQVREVLGDCTRCRLCEQRTQIVFGDGNPQAQLMFVGEGPGEPPPFQ